MAHEDYLKILESLYVAVVCDILDDLGYRNQIMETDIRPLTKNSKLFGRVVTARAENVNETPEEPYKLEMKMIDDLTSGDVLLVEAGHNRSCGMWGELLTTAAIANKGHGVVMTACTRDHWAIDEMGFPVFGIGYHPADSKARLDIVELGSPIEISGVKCKNGDYIIADFDGVVIIPQEAIDETLTKSVEKVSGENRVRQEILDGASMTEVFAKYGIL